MKKINPKMVQLARESRGFNQTELADKLNIPQGNLSRMERGEVGIKDELLKQLTYILGYPEDFFYLTNAIGISDTHYRKAITIDQKTKLQAEALMNIYKFNVEEMLKSLDIKKNIPAIEDQYDSPERIAKYLRSYWRIPRGAIENLTKLVEDNGVIVIPIDFGTDLIDGRTILTDTGYPLIFINKSASNDRQRTTLCHELGHVILHLNGFPTFARDEESEAFNFAAEFLMPIAECGYEFNDKLSIEKLAQLKRVWKVSMQSILYRAQKQELVNKNRCRYLWSIFNAKGWRKKEPIELETETPTLLLRMINAMINGLEYSKRDIAKIFSLTEKEFQERYFPTSSKLRVA